MNPEAEGALQRQADALERLAEATELQNALLLQVVQELQADRAARHPDPERSRSSDASVASSVIDSYGDLYGGRFGGDWEFDPISEQVDGMGGHNE
jgi:hypothetical protein